MSKPRMNMYSGIHKALRAQMAAAMTRLACTDADDAQDLRDTLAQVRTLLDNMQQHLQHEREHVHPAMEARRPGSAQAAEHDHDEHMEAIGTLRTLCEHTAAGSARHVPLGELHLQLSVFVGENLVHMNMEETEHNAVLWECYSDEELGQVHQRILGSIAPEQMQATMRWMLPALNPSERAGMCGGMRATMPADAFAGMLGLTRSLIGEREMAKLEQALGTVRAMAA
jgi:hypothetical protein